MSTSADNPKVPVDLASVTRAHERIRDAVVRTPLLPSERLSERAGCTLLLKAENLQHIGAFKARGATNAVRALPEEAAARGVATHSSGNHAAALARAARLRGIPAHIVMPENTARNKVEAVRRLGVEPIFCAPDATSRQSTADRVVAETGATLIHPYENPDVISGQGTVALEILEQEENIDTIVVPVGGGGLLSGILTVVQALRPEIRVVAAEPELADDAWRSLRSGRREMPTRYDTLADGLRTPLGTPNYEIISTLLDEILLASEREIIDATRLLAREARLVAEPSGAVPLAAILRNPTEFRGQRVVVVVSGGNLDPDLLEKVTF